jgi:hypothetical protein
MEECPIPLEHSKHQPGEVRLTFLILENSSQELFKDTFWPDQLKGLWQDRPHLNPVYDTENHDNGHCKCKCTPVPIEHVTCPTKTERLVKRLRGRPKTQRRDYPYLRGKGKRAGSEI